MLDVDRFEGESRADKERAHLLLPRSPSVGTSTVQPGSETVTIGTNLLLLVAGCCAKNSAPPLTVAHHLVVKAFSPVCSGGQFATACTSSAVLGGPGCELLSQGLAR